MPVVNGAWICPGKAWLKHERGKSGMPEPKIGPGGVAMFPKAGVDKFIDTPIFQLCHGRGIAMDIEQTAVEVSGAADEALRSLKATLDKFKSSIGNDLTAIKAASARVQSETQQMKQAYQTAQAVLTNPEFERAIVNAERMAVALKAISELSQTKLSVAVFSGGQESTPSSGPEHEMDADKLRRLRGLLDTVEG